jgi:ketosteroid isomerase-like protein
MNRVLTLALAAVLTGHLPAGAETIEELKEQVRQAEIAFAKSMADRDHAAFVSHLAPEAIFFGPGGSVLRGAEAVAKGWKPFFEKERAPFTWAPEQVEVLASGSLAHSSGPVLDAAGKRVATFNSVWLREVDGRWRVVLDKGCEACSCAP